jgi:hypothetical protein
VAALQALFLIPIAVLSPGLGLLFALSISGRWLLADPKRQRVFFPVLVAGLALLWLMKDTIPGMPGNVPMALALVGTGVCATVAFYVFTRTWRISLPMVTVAYLHLTAAMIIPEMWPREYWSFVKQTTDTFDAAFREAMKAGVEDQATVQVFHNAVDYALRNLQPGLWTLGMVLATCVGLLMLTRGVAVHWRFDRLRLPFHPVFLIILGLGLCLHSATRAFSANILIMLGSLLTIQGISILLFFGRRLFKGSFWLNLILIIAIVINPVFILMIALLGAIDLWFNIRKISPEEEIDESDLSE